MGYSLDLLKEESSAFYVPLLFVPENKREAIASLYAFHNEIGRIAYLVSEPLPGEIRLQWWREVLTGEGEDRSGEAQANPLAAELRQTINQHDLPLDGFARYLDARIFDLYNDPMPDRGALEAYFGETNSFILQCASMVLGAERSSDLADACGHGGVASGICERILSVAADRSLQKTYIPRDLLDAAGLTAEEWHSEVGEKHLNAVMAFYALGREHMDRAFTAIQRLPKENQTAFLPLAMPRRFFCSPPKPTELFEGTSSISPMARHWSVLKTALFGF